MIHYDIYLYFYVKVGGELEKNLYSSFLEYRPKTNVTAENDVAVAWDYLQDWVGFTKLFKDIKWAYHQCCDCEMKSSAFISIPTWEGLPTT